MVGSRQAETQTSIRKWPTYIKHGIYHTQY